MTNYAAYLALTLKPVGPDAHSNIRVGTTGGYSPGGPLVIDPDDYLETESGRLFTPERIAVFLNASLELAKSRNTLRSADKRVPVSALESVYSLLESPVEDEGFIDVKTIAVR